jgi:hypothetical protein
MMKKEAEAQKVDQQGRSGSDRNKTIKDNFQKTTDQYKNSNPCPGSGGC